MEAEKETSRAQAWFCTTGLPSDIAVAVCDMTFHLHKFPLVSKSRKLHNLIAEQETNRGGEEDKYGDGDEIHQEQLRCQISLPDDFPGGSEAFEAAAKFCYGIKVELTSSNVAPLRCAAEFLEMTDDYSPDNLVSRADRFLSQSVLESLGDSVRALKSCDSLMPMAESLNIAQRCVDSIALRASSAEAAALFGQATPKVSSSKQQRQIVWNGIEIGARRKVAASAAAGSWLEGISHLSLPLFSRLVSAMKSSNVSAGIVESCLLSYAKRSIPGICRSNRQQQQQQSTGTTAAASETQQRELLEILVANLPLAKSAGSATATRLLFGMLRAANILNASEACRFRLEKKIGSQLERATADDLLIPSYSSLKETLYDVDCVGRILGHFLHGVETSSEEGEDRSQACLLVGKLFDAYLSEIASDANLRPDKFHQLAVSLPERARLFGDGLYRAVDVYLRAHPRMTDPEQEMVSGVIDCRKLTLEACTHAAQNERLPLRAVVQVLFFEQLQLRHAIAGTLLYADPAHTESPVQGEGGPPPPAQDSSSATWRRAATESQVLRLDMDSMRTRVGELERECSSMRKSILNIDGVGPTRGGACADITKGWRDRLGCKFKAQVRDSHEPTVAEVKKSQHHNRRRHHRSDHRKPD